MRKISKKEFIKQCNKLYPSLIILHFNGIKSQCTVKCMSHNVKYKTNAQSLWLGSRSTCCSKPTVNLRQYRGRIVTKHPFLVVPPLNGRLSPIKCKCKKCGNIWNTTAYRLLNSIYGCPYCAKVKRIAKLRCSNIEDLITKTHGNKVRLVSPYRNMTSKHIFECSRGHKWETSPQSVVNLKTGCAICASTNNGYSNKAIEWLTKISLKYNIHIEHACNGGERFGLLPKLMRPDGYCAANKTFYEFYGDIWHGNPLVCKPRSKPNFHKPSTTARKLFEQTKLREQLILNAGYKLVVIWEKDYDEGRLYSYKLVCKLKR